jgi:hypothetical protein
LRRSCTGCGGCLLWGVVVVLLVNGWVGSTWAERAVELLLGAVVGGAAIAVRRHRPLESRESVPAPQRPARAKTTG